MQGRNFIVLLRGWMLAGVRFVRSKNTLTFFAFLVLAFFMWLLHGSSNSGKLHGNVNVVYSGLPSNVRLSESLPTEVHFQMKDENAWVLDYLFFDLEGIHIDLSEVFVNNHSHRIEIDFSSQLQRMFRQRGKEVHLLEVSPSLFESDYELMDRKEVPLRYVGDFTLVSNAVLTDSIRLQPSHTIISGPKDMLSDIDELLVQQSFRNVSRSVEADVIVASPASIVVEDSVVRLVAKVETATEKSLVLPVRIIGQPEDMTVRTFPSEVAMRFSVGLSRYREVCADDFELVVDYDTIEVTRKQRGAASVPLQLRVCPEWVKNVRLATKEVEFVVVNN